MSPMIGSSPRWRDVPILLSGKCEHVDWNLEQGWCCLFHLTRLGHSREISCFSSTACTDFLIVWHFWNTIHFWTVFYGCVLLILHAPTRIGFQSFPGWETGCFPAIALYLCIVTLYNPNHQAQAYQGKTCTYHSFHVSSFLKVQCMHTLASMCILLYN